MEKVKDDNSKARILEATTALLQEKDLTEQVYGEICKAKRRKYLHDFLLLGRQTGIVQRDYRKPARKTD